MFISSILFLIFFIVALTVRFVFGKEDQKEVRLGTTIASVIFLVLSVALFVGAGITSVGTASLGIITSFGKVTGDALPEGAHFILPYQQVNEMYLGQQQALTKSTEASSKDLQKVHADFSINFTVDPAQAIALFRMNPTQSYATLIMIPSIGEVFKSVVAQYTAEELITHRNEVSAAIVTAISKRVAPYHLLVQNVNLTNFGFSPAFDAAIEEKVTMTEKAKTAVRALEKAESDAKSRIAQARGEAEAIKIQAEAVAKAGGDDYVKLQAIEKWDGKLPSYMTGGVGTPFIGVK